jgi:phosphohistidine phosphatase
MHLLVIRHAIAEDREEFASSGRDDSERPLTKVGRRRMRRNAQGLRRVAPGIDAMATSPYVRASETASILAEAIDYKGEIASIDALTPEQPSEALLPWLAQHAADATVAVVGHEPHLGRLVTWFLTGNSESHVMLKKGGVVLLDVGVRPGAGSAILHWALTPGQLRSLAD